MTVTGNAKVGKVTKHLAPNIKAGEIAVIDHEDIDRLGAESLIEAHAAAVVNASRSVSGKFPNLAPKMILDAGIPIIDSVGQGIFEEVQDGDQICISGCEVHRFDENGPVVATGILLTSDEVESKVKNAEESIDADIAEFVDNTAEYLKMEKGKVLYNPNVPKVKTKISGRQVLVVVRGPDYKEDLHTLRSYISEMKPAIIAVDGGADAVIEAGYTPDIIVGDMDSVSDSALKCGAEVIPHAYEDGTCTSRERLESLGIECNPWPLSATSEDLALLLAWENNADLIVAVGTHSNLIEYMEKGRNGMASTFLVRLKVGTKLVDAKGVSKLYKPAPPGRYALMVIACALIAIFTVIFISEPLRNAFMVMWLSFRTQLGF